MFLLRLNLNKFDLAYVDWSEVNASKTAIKVYSAIDWSSEPISPDVAVDLNWSLVNFSKFDSSSLADINDLAFDTLGKNYTKFKWDELDYSTLDADSLEAIDWSKVDFKKATKSDSFNLDVVNWAEVATSKKAVKE